MAQFRDIAFKMTPQRAAILNYLDGNTSHPSAEDIYEAVRQDFPMMSLATVYNTLDTLRDLGRVWELGIDNKRRRYDPNTEQHHHMICLECREVVDVMIDFKLDIPEDSKHGYDITGVQVDFYGYCPRCKAKARSAADKDKVSTDK